MANTNKLDGLDALRGLLSLVVVIAHSWQVFVSSVAGNDTAIGSILGILARASVLLFFCLSGYVIAFSVSKNVQKNGAFNLFAYARSRVIRVVPPLVIVSLAVYALTRVARRIGIDTLPTGVIGARDIYAVDIGQQFDSLYYLCGISDYDITGILNGPLWSLKYEIQLYVIFGLSAAIFLARGTIWRIICAGVLCYYAYYATDTYLRYPTMIVPYTWGVRMQFVWFAVFSIGAAAFALSRRSSNNILVRIIFCGSAVSALLMASFRGESLATSLDSSSLLIAAQVSFSVAGAALVVLMSRISVFKVLAAMGNYSFTLYITHFPVLLFGYFCVVHIVPHYGMVAALMLAVVGCAVCVWIARISYQLVEHSTTKTLNFVASLFMRKKSQKF